MKTLKHIGRPGLIIYITGGYPDMTTTIQAVLAAEKAGADVVEIGIPFSDPMADGPVIQQAATQALKGGASVSGILNLVKEIRIYSQLPLALMTYVNPVLQYGPELFVQAAKQAGADGLIVPDLPLEECQMLAGSCQVNDIDLVQFIAPTTTVARMATICGVAEGFIYCVSNTGVTGVRDIDYSRLDPVVTGIRQYTDVPVAIGFGIASPDAARQAARYADAVIVGSAVMERLMDGGVGKMYDFVVGLRQALDEGRQ
jgi:tryptophan synthase alpha chain